MSFFSLRMLPGYQWPPLADAGLAQVWVAYLELNRTQWLGAEELEKQQLVQVRALLSHCVNYVPYYREALPRAGIVPGAIRTLEDFRRLPLLPRRTYQEQAAAFDAQRLPAGTVATVTRQTSGSSGTPTRVLQTNLVNLWWCAFYLRDLEWSDVAPSGTLAAIRSTGHKGKAMEPYLKGVCSPAWVAELQTLLATGPSHLMDVQQDHRVQVQWLRSLAPDCLLSYPSNLEVLANLLEKDGPIPSLKRILAISETLEEEQCRRIESVFGVPVKNTYSCAETGYLASTCPEGIGLHVHAENVILEVLDAQGNPCQPGETGRVYVTHLHNFRSPFVRYELGDEATVGAEPCPCGRGLPLLKCVQGKSYPMFRLKDNRYKSSVTVAYLVRKVGGHWQHQVVQKAVDHVVVRLAVNADWSESHATNLRQRLQGFFEAPLRVDIEIHDRLPVPESGKFQSMINELQRPAGKGA